MSIDIFSDLPEEQFEENYDPTYSVGPVRKGRYEGLVTFAEDDVDPGKQWNPKEQDNGPTHFWAKIKATINGDSPATGRKVYGMISTKPFRAGKDTDKLTSGADKFLRALGERDRAIEANSPRDKARAITSVIGDGVHAIFDVDWVCSYLENGERKYVRGEDSFPKDGDGNPIPELQLENGETVRAQAEFKVVGVAG